MNCPRCKATIGPLANPDGIVTCPGCGSRLMTRSAAIRSQGGPRAAAPASSPSTALPVSPAVVELPPPSATLPPTPAQLLGIQRPFQPPAPAAARKRPADDGVRPPKPRSRPVPVAGPGTPSPGGTPDPPAGAVPGQVTLELLLSELHEVKALELRILGRLEESTATASATGTGFDDDATLVAPIRARRQKTVVLIDDDSATREAAVAELLQADVPVRAFADGNAAVAAIAEQKPDVIVLELGLGGEMAGRDVVNMIKSTMEWVDIPIVLWTREAVANQKEARLLHGADELVAKPSGTAALVARVIALFRRVH